MAIRLIKSNSAVPHVSRAFAERLDLDFGDGTGYRVYGVEGAIRDEHEISPASLPPRWRLKVQEIVAKQIAGGHLDRPESEAFLDLLFAEQALHTEHMQRQGHPRALSQTERLEADRQPLVVDSVTDFAAGGSAVARRANGGGRVFSGQRSYL